MTTEATTQQKTEMAATAPMTDGEMPAIDLRDRSLYFNRQLSQFDFMARVFDEALDEQNPLLERVKFLSICGMLVDEIYETRVAALRDQQISGHSRDISRDAMPPSQQLLQIYERAHSYVNMLWAHLRDTLIPEMTREGIFLQNHEQLKKAQQQEMRDYYEREIFPLLTPLAVDAWRPFPHISGGSLNLLVVIPDGGGELIARVKVPPSLPRLVAVPSTESVESADGWPQVTFTWLEQIIAANVDTLFPGKTIAGAYFFRVNRNADLGIREDEAEDLLETIEESLERRLFGYTVRLEVSSAMPEGLRAWLADQLESESLADAGADLVGQDVYVTDGPLGLNALGGLGRINRPDLKDPPFVAGLPAEWPRDGSNVLDLIARHDVLLHHPYHSFSPVVDFVRSGLDPNVRAIKQTLYRVGSNSPIVDALLESRDDDTQVAVMVELKARGDEESNIGWARRLEQAGVHVSYGLVGLKTHCKLALIVRREVDGLRRYAHLGTGNYNASTARLYTDLGIFTADPDICADVSDLFNYLTGYSEQATYRKLIVAPMNLRRQLMELIERETGHGERGRLIFKMNALIDGEMIEALYRASQAGVKISLLIRGACCLRPGLAGISENIQVTSIVGRFLEHSRIFYFGNGCGDDQPQDDQIYMGSADLMTRNLDRRVEVLFPVESPSIKSYIRDELLPLFLSDNVKTRILQSDGVYIRRQPAPDEPVVNAQQVLMAQASAVIQP